MIHQPCAECSSTRHTCTREGAARRPALLGRQVRYVCATIMMTIADKILSSGNACLTRNPAVSTGGVMAFSPPPEYEKPLLKHIVSSRPYLQRPQKPMQHDIIEYVVLDLPDWPAWTTPPR